MDEGEDFLRDQDNILRSVMSRDTFCLPISEDRWKTFETFEFAIAARGVLIKTGLCGRRVTGALVSTRVSLV